MKKVLLATSALVASASIAAAEITVSGSAEMGIAGGDRYDVPALLWPGSDPRFWNDFTIKFVGSGETDNGITFGLLIELEESNGEGAINGFASFDNEAVFISGAYGTLTLGETDGAFDKRNIEVALAGGSIADDETEHAGYFGGDTLDGIHDNQILRYDYEFGDFGFSASIEQGNDGNSGATGEDDDVYAVGVSWKGDFGGVGVNVGLAYATSDSIDFNPAPGGNFGVDLWGLSTKADFGNGFMLAASYANINIDAPNSDGEHYAIGAAYETGPWTFAANYGKYDWDPAASTISSGFVDADGWGAVVNYDLGGGAVVQLGYGDGEGTESYSLGVAMSF